MREGPTQVADPAGRDLRRYRLALDQLPFGLGEQRRAPDQVDETRLGGDPAEQLV